MNILLQQDNVNKRELVELQPVENIYLFVRKVTSDLCRAIMDIF